MVENFIHWLRVMEGPEFLVVFSVWFLLTWVLVLVLRQHGFDTPLLNVGGFALFEALGIARYVLSEPAGMEDWGFMVLMMLFGGLCFFLRARHFKQGGKDSGSSGCFSAGGCGSGGSCGGGGCGGCGGG